MIPTGLLRVDSALRICEGRHTYESANPRNHTHDALAARHVRGGNAQPAVGQNIAVTVLTISIAAVLAVCSIGCNAPAISRIATITAITIR